jgi:hypothetical protein
MKDDLNIFLKVKMTSNIFVNARQPQIFLEVEDNFKPDLKYSANTIISMNV